MFIPRSKQTDFFDAEALCERLIPKDSFYRKFRENVWPLLDDEQFESMYCKDNGRPPISLRFWLWLPYFSSTVIFQTGKWNVPPCMTSR
jgi:hypothetical protein